MAWNPREIMKELEKNIKEVGKERPEVQAFLEFTGKLMAPSALDLKTKELISVAIAVYIKCKYCIVTHVYNALKAGATEDEIMEAALVAVQFGGGPAISHCVTLVNESIKEFAHEFEN
ncbi:MULTISPECIES: carboxymuconolactone decarboxylase family protein [Acetomicrobium]|jgi:AhpD family alkylhydroperoxidase|uniref:carboxymuconolactone decarboxylase family protein n=2 Tax=Acetomicrobiaceae TaxID=3029086 RepID=UPI0026E92F0F|nr:carboxymuconolactone decarboxylase family protein [Acetomicrobium mobile]MDI9377684.1 carboxymuconolactone decarboxylase family protein [Synergistota bacterium]HQA36393.1 carboxymuconolactone decarboxylase family protein [Acetomicrobium sp.]